MQGEEISSRTAKLKEYTRDPKSVYTRSKLKNDKVIMLEGKPCIPIALRNRLLNWYHLYLCQSSSTHLGKTIQQAYDWLGLIAQPALYQKVLT